MIPLSDVPISSKEFSKKSNSKLQSYSIFLSIFQDVDGSGYISKEEMLKSISNCEYLRGEKEEEAVKCLADIDVDGDGRVSYPEFLLVWKFKY